MRVTGEPPPLRQGTRRNYKENEVQTNINLSIPGTNVRLGDKARDPVTGFEGIVTCHQRHLTGCDSVWLTGPIGDDGKKREAFVDVLRLELVKANPLKATPLPKLVPPSG
jgi:hypothetical protein